MKTKLKSIAVAAALASMAGAANADITSGFTDNGTLVLWAYDTANRDYYLRDLGFTINSFMPNGQNAAVGDPASSAVGDKTPEAGLNLSSTDASGWATWIAGRVLGNIRWVVTAVDSVTSTGNAYRAILSSANLNETGLNDAVSNFVSEPYAGSAEGYAALANGGTPGLSFTSNEVDAPDNIDSNFGFGTDGLGLLGQNLSLFYYVRVGPTGPAAGGRYQNSLYSSIVSLDNAGNFSYSLQSGVTAVPLPAGVWLLGAGLLALGGAVRRRQAQEA